MTTFTGWNPDPPSRHNDDTPDTVTTDQIRYAATCPTCRTRTPETDDRTTAVQAALACCRETAPMKTSQRRN